MSNVQSDFDLLANLNSLKVPELKKALKERGIAIAASAKKPDLVAKLTEVLTSSTSKATDVSADDDFEQQLAEITEGKTGVSLPPSSAESTLKSQPKSDLIKPSNAITTVTGSSFPRTVTTNTSTTSQANGSGTASGKVSTSSSTTPLSSSKSSNESNIKKVVTKSASVHPLDKLAARAARFGSLEEDKTSAKSAKTTVAPASSAELEALKKRKERFGVAVSPSLEKLETNEKLAQRASRFGMASDSAVSTGVKRLSSVEDEKLKKRRERFGL